MEITSLLPETPTVTKPVESAASRLSSDFETFLFLLTAQLKYQDPLDPVDSSDYATQLATFSGVEQQVKTNDLLESLGRQFGEMGMAQLAGWVGMEARVAAPAFFDGQPLVLYPTTAASADDAKLVVRDASGQEVSRQQIALGSAPISWAGTDTLGNPLPAGNYSFVVESYANTTLIGQDTVEIYALVGEAKFADGVMMVVLEGGAEIAVSQIVALRAATD
ncbi:MAG: flagellar hook capping FlgD N-terminal domain-containing protein [Paracoccaceae bacterium]